MAAKKTKKKTASARGGQKLTFIVSDDKKPKIALERGMRLQVVQVDLVDTQLKPIRRPVARLCGGTSTCLAVVFTDKGDPAP